MSAIAKLLKKNERLNRWQMICLYFALVIGLPTWGIMMVLGMDEKICWEMLYSVLIAGGIIGWAFYKREISGKPANGFQQFIYLIWYLKDNIKANPVAFLKSLWNEFRYYQGPAKRFALKKLILSGCIIFNMILGFAFVLAGIIVAAFAAGGAGATRICPHCGAYVDAGEEYCPDCGGPLF